jgi:hypothetical protein
LKQLLRDARRVEKDLPKAMRQSLLPISRQVLSRATQRAQSQGGVAAHAVKRGLRAGATQNTAWIKLLGREPTIFGAEFGGGHRRTTRQFKPWRGSGNDAGYFVYPAIRASVDDVSDQVEDAVNDLIRFAGFR